MPTTDTLYEFCGEILAQAEWRAQKAAEWPDDERNLNAAEGLEDMHAWFAELDDDAAIKSRLGRALTALAVDPDTYTTFQPCITDRLGRFGFDHVPEREEYIGQRFERFLSELCCDIEKHLSRARAEAIVDGLGISRPPLIRTVTLRALIGRINRKLTHEEQRLCTTRGDVWHSRAGQEFGSHYILDYTLNIVTAHHVDPEALGRELGVLAAHEQLVAAG